MMTEKLEMIDVLIRIFCHSLNLLVLPGFTQFYLFFANVANPKSYFH
jgi:hypothetical protein